MRAHNVEFKLWDERLLAERNPLKRLVLASAVKQLKKFELNAINKFDRLATISMNDKAYFSGYLGLRKTVYIPFGIPIPKYESTALSANNRYILFLGALDWEPNITGLKWFLNHVWPLIHLDDEKLTFHIGGRNASQEFIDHLPKGVIFDGEVNNAHEYIRKGMIMVVPLFESSGIRIKIIEGLALGQVIVTTSKGAMGIPVQNGRDILIADHPKQMAQSILQIIHSADKSKSISSHAKALAKREFDIVHTQKALHQMISTLK